MRTIATLACAVACAAGAQAAEQPAVTAKVWQGNLIVVTAPAGSSIDARTAAQLGGQVTFAFEDTALADVAAFFRKTCGVNIVISPEAAAQAKTVTFSATAMTASTALEWVAKQAGVTLSYVNEAVYLDTKPYAGASETRVYDVTDLVNPVRDFPGPTLGVPEPGGKGTTICFPVEDATSAPPSAEDLAQLIEQQVGPQVAK